jgi:hypothetical protein
MNFLKSYISGFNRLFPKFARNQGGWIGAAIMAGGALLGGLMSQSDDGGGDAPKPKILPKTVSGQNVSNFDILYDEEAEVALANLAEQVGQWSQDDRDFFTNTFQPFQQTLIETNQALLPAIEKTAGTSLEEVSRNLFSNRALKDTLSRAIEQIGGDVGQIAGNFKQELDNLPTAEERIGQALTAVEGQFGKAGEALKRDLASRGIGVSQATERQLAIEKAKAKAGAVGAAAEMARTERRQALSEGLGVMSGIQGQSTQQLLGIGAQDLQAGQAATAAQVGGTVEPGTKLTELQAGLTEAQATKELGTEALTRDIQFTQKGIKRAPMVDEEGQFTPAEQNIRDLEKENARLEEEARLRSRVSAPGFPSDGGPDPQGGYGMEGETGWESIGFDGSMDFGDQGNSNDMGNLDGGGHGIDSGGYGF